MRDQDAPVEDGWNRFYVQSSGALQRDLSVYRDATFGDRAFTIAGDVHGAEIVDAGGIVVLKAVVKKALGATIEYTNADGTPAANLKTNSIFSKKRMEFTLAGGTEWTFVQSGALKQIYTVLQDGAPIATLDLTDLALRKKYPVAFAEGVDLPLALGLVWALNFAYLQRVGAAGGVAAT